MSVRSLAGLTVVTLVATALAVAPAIATGTAPAPDSLVDGVTSSTPPAIDEAVLAGATAPVPVVSGTRLIDARDGTRWAPRGVAAPTATRFDLPDVDTLASWGVDLLRLPVDPRCWHDPYPSGSGPACSAEAVHARVDQATAAGLAVLLVLDVGSADARSLVDDLGGAFASSPSVLFELTGGEQDAGLHDPRDARLELVGALRRAGAAQPVLLPGADGGNDLRPFVDTRAGDGQLVAAWQIAPGDRCRTPYCWRGEVERVTGRMPVLLTAFELRRTDITERLLDWADASGVGYVAGLPDPDDRAVAAFRSHLTALRSTPVGPPDGALDAVVRLGGAVHVVGWAFDPDTSAPVRVRLTLDGSYLDSGWADRTTRDPSPALPALATRRGYRFALPFPLRPPGAAGGAAGTAAGTVAPQAELCVRALDPGGGRSGTTLGCVMVRTG